MASQLIELTSGQFVIVLASEEHVERSKQLVEELKKRVEPSGKVTSLSRNSLSTNNKGESGYDACIIGFDFPLLVSEDVLAFALEVLKPSGRLWLLEPVTGNEETTSAECRVSVLKLNGFVDPEVKAISSDTEKRLKEEFNIQNGTKFSCVCTQKPNYELGSSVQIKLNSSVKNELTPAQQVWKLSADDLDDYDDDLLDSDEVLDEDDLRKPDPASLRSTCGDASVKRKACKNCTCGLAEELEAERTQKELEGIDPGQKKSSCGSCYLGDAFRCTGCPYRGLPAFKPGENVPIPQ